MDGEGPREPEEVPGEPNLEAVDNLEFTEEERVEREAEKRRHPSNLYSEIEYLEE